MVFIDRTAVALRLLAAVNRHEKPADADALILYLLCPGHEGLEPDELAGIIVRESEEVRAVLHACSYFGD